MVSQAVGFGMGGAIVLRFLGPPAPRDKDGDLASLKIEREQADVYYRRRRSRAAGLS